MNDCSEKFVESGGTGIPPEHQMRQLLRPAPPNFSSFRVSPGLMNYCLGTHFNANLPLCSEAGYPDGKLSLAKRSLEPMVHSQAGAWEREEKNFQRITGGGQINYLTPWRRCSMIRKPMEKMRKI
jgi:hypothetical protein